MFRCALLLALACASFAAQLPAHFPKCYRDKDDSVISDCLMDAADKVREDLKVGVPELGIPPTSPLIVPEITVEQGTQHLNFRLTIINASIDGLDTYKFKEFSFDPKAKSWKGIITFDSITVTGVCDFSGKVLLSPLEGKGKFKAVTGAAEGLIDVTGSLVKRHGKDYYNVDDVKVDLKVQDGKLDLEELTSDNAEFAHIANQIIKEHGRAFVGELREPLQKVASDIVKDILGKTARKVPYDELFPLKE